MPWVSDPGAPSTLRNAALSAPARRLLSLPTSMIPASLLTVLLLSAAPAAPRLELDGLAARIEQLKVRRLSGENVDRELERLLVRAQEVVLELEQRQGGAPPSALPVADELRERADALHDEADRLAAALGVLDVRIADARRLAAVEGGGGMTRGAAIGTGPRPTGASARLAALLDERARVAARLVQVRAAAAALEAEVHAEDDRR
jgi:hypothetical protein